MIPYAVNNFRKSVMNKAVRATDMTSKIFVRASCLPEIIDQLISQHLITRISLLENLWQSAEWVFL